MGRLNAGPLRTNEIEPPKQRHSFTTISVSLPYTASGRAYTPINNANAQTQANGILIVAVLVADLDATRKSLSTPGSDVALITICVREGEAEFTIRDEIVNHCVILASK